METKAIVAKVTFLSNVFPQALGENHRITTNVSLKEYNEKALSLEKEHRVRTFRNYKDFVKAVMSIIKQIPTTAQPKFADGGEVSFYVKHWFMDDNATRVNLVFEKGSTDKNQRRMPTTKLKRVEVTNSHGDVSVI